MANQISVAVYAINGSPQTEAFTMSFPTKEIIIQEATSDTISQVASKITYFPNPSNPILTQEFLISQTVAQCETAANTGTISMIAATVWRNNDYDYSASKDFLLPADKISVWPFDSDPIDAYIQFNGQQYYCEESVSDIVTAANA